jgi:hypothetical protein
MEHRRGFVGNWFMQRYSRQGLWSLFLMCALPLHAWTLILAFRDLSWVTDRTNAWDAIGVLCYGLLFAFVESLLVFVIATLLGFLVSGRWEPDRRLGVMSALVLIMSLWAMGDQLFFLLNLRVPGAFIEFALHAGHPLRAMYGVFLAIVAATLIIPVLLILRSKRAPAVVRGMIDRLSLLAMFYLAFDVAALVIVVIRNL